MDKQVKRTVVTALLRAGRADLARVVATRAWHDLPGNVPEGVRDVLQRALDYAYDNAMDTDYRQNPLEMSYGFWERVVEQLDDHLRWNAPELHQLVKGRLDRTKVRDRKDIAKQVPRKARAAIEPILDEVVEAEKARINREVQRDPEAHPEFESVWHGGLADTIETGIDEVNERRRLYNEKPINPKVVWRWAAKLGLD